MRVLLLLAALVLSAAPALARTIDGGTYGTVEVTDPDGAMRGFVVLFSAHGWTESDRQAAATLAHAGIFVAGVDTDTYLARLGAMEEPCRRLHGDAEALSHQIERELETPRYLAPILAGTGQGARIALTALQNAPANTIAGVVAAVPDPALDNRVRACPDDTGRAGPAGFVDQTSEDGLTARVIARASPPPVPPREEESASAGGDLSDLPLTELPAAHPDGRLAVVLSGDGGWRDIDKTIAEDLRAAGVSVIGWDSLRYFWHRQTPERTAADLARVLRAYMARWHAHSVALVGYSFGADVIPFAYNRLPADLRAAIVRVSLLGFAPAADFEIRVGGWLGLPPSADALPALPEIAGLPPGLVQCFYGADEDDTACPGLAGSGVQVIRTAGSHHFDGDYHALSRAVLEGWGLAPARLSRSDGTSRSADP